MNYRKNIWLFAFADLAFLLLIVFILNFRFNNGVCENELERLVLKLPLPEIVVDPAKARANLPREETWIVFVHPIIFLDIATKSAAGKSSNDDLNKKIGQATPYQIACFVNQEENKKAVGLNGKNIFGPVNFIHLKERLEILKKGNKPAPILWPNPNSLSQHTFKAAYLIRDIWESQSNSYASQTRHN